MLLSGQSPDGRLVEIVELKDHPWFVASQFHPEFKSRPERPHPLFDGFVAASIAVADGREPIFRARSTESKVGIPVRAETAACPDRVTRRGWRASPRPVRGLRRRIHRPDRLENA